MTLSRDELNGLAKENHSLTNNQGGFSQTGFQSEVEFVFRKLMMRSDAPGQLVKSGVFKVITRKVLQMCKYVG